MSTYINHVDDTICSLITPPGISGIAVIRVSGSKTVSLVDQLTKLSFSKNLESHKCYYTKLYDPKKLEIIDEVLITYFAKGKSFTGDESVEISCHGGNLVWKVILNHLVDLGCRTAQRGEFSFRAFYNGKIDLLQAEAIHGLIESSSSVAKKVSLSQLEGVLSKNILKHEDNLIKILANLEASIDFSTEDIDPYPYSLILQDLSKTLDYFNNLSKSYAWGSKLKNSNKVLICGEPNVGKSSLFNAIVNKDRSIVTDIEGTTRDLVNEILTLKNGIEINLVDSAGLRETTDKVESIGIRKAFESMEQANVVMLVVSAENFKKNIDLAAIYPHLNIEIGQKILVILNKIDLLKSDNTDNIQLPNYVKKLIKVSAKTGEGVNLLLDELAQLTEINQENVNFTITERRHYELSRTVLESLKKAENMLKKEESPDIVSQEMQVALFSIQQLLGKSYDDQIVDSIFKQFCLGK